MSEDEHKFICELCRELRVDGQSCFYKFPDAGRGGSDLDGFCCKDCASYIAKDDFDGLFDRMRKSHPIFDNEEIVYE